MSYESFPTLDAHAHLDPARTADELAQSGVVLSMSLSLASAAQGLQRQDAFIAWGVGCYPGKTAAIESFDLDLFSEMVRRSAIVGEVGLDTGARVPFEQQLRVFRQVLQVVSAYPRLVSIHSYRATAQVLAELRQIPIQNAVLHWWTGTAAETSLAVELGCYFSIHSQVARHSKFRTRVPPQRILVESDHGFCDPPAAVGCRIAWVEHLVAQQFGMAFEDVRCLAWKNFATIIRQTATQHLLPTALGNLVDKAGFLDG